uniref:Uncharacterized protein n=1 Tax=Arcella intermedia TaxID=1963864 RepID=A0A6B2LB49_9EUKA|eukprot:TRINITY_DN11198_c0_g1_i2.p1 TRINITY_DN11198_c0_g1~~TRINITY_DN11198_c0_g1_i2.p1  ORF type:complete len:307 (-),score=73.59 TRINITY_DN11198_c0_g1_i2:1092-2012(-)
MESGGAVVITGSYDNTIKLWNPATATVNKSFPHNNSQVNELLIYAPYFIAAGNPELRFYNMESSSSSPVYTFVGHKDNVTGMCFEKGGRWMVSGSEDRTVKIWAFNKNGPQINFELDSQVNCLSLHPNQVEVICGCEDGLIRVIDLVAGKEVTTTGLQTLDDHTIRSLSVSPDGTLLVAGDDSGHLYVCPVPDNTAAFIRSDNVREIGAHENYILKCRFSPDGTKLATSSSDSTTKIWNIDWKLDKILTGHSSWVWGACFSADGAYLLTGSSDKLAMLWELQSGTNVKLYQGEHTRAVSAVALYDF